VPTSVLLAVLAAAGMLALAPALVRRYDATERLVAERALSTARILSRHRRRRTVPVFGPINLTPASVRATLAAAIPCHKRPPITPPGRAATPATPTPTASASDPAPAPTPPTPILTAAERARWWRYRRRRILQALMLLLGFQTTGVVLIGPGFWIGFGLSGVMLTAYLVYLRNLVISERERQRAALRAERRRRIAAARRRAARIATIRVAERERVERARQRAVARQATLRARRYIRGQAYEARASNF